VHLEQKIQLEDLHTRALRITNQIAFFLDCTNKRRQKRSRKADLQEAEELLEEAQNFALEMPAATHLKSVLRQSQDWLKESEQVLNVQPSLKRLEELVALGERLPFDFSEELEKLKEKRNKARMWMEKLKKSMPKTKITTRGRDGEKSKPKLELKEVQAMLNEGEQYRIQSKELCHVQGVVSSAQGWIARMKEALDTVETDEELAGLAALLKEADQIPVFMEEVQLLKAHMQGVEWGRRASSLLATGKAKLSDLQRMLREVARSTSSMRCRIGYLSVHCSLGTQAEVKSFDSSASGTHSEDSSRGAYQASCSGCRIVGAQSTCSYSIRFLC
jgi:chemotaxis protein histidine kinase CheA